MDAANHEARRWLGQHFLIDHSVILDAVAAADVRPDDRILEIGPGTGNLTVELLKAGARVTAVEKDRNLADKLVTTFAEEENLRVHEADFLKWNVVESFADVTAAVAARTGDPDEPDARAKVVANIPYNITTDILKTLLPMGTRSRTWCSCFQEEVAQRLIAASRSGRLPTHVRPRALLQRALLHPTGHRRVFRPAPQRGIVPDRFQAEAVRGSSPAQRHREAVLHLRPGVLAQKRKMLKNNLKAVCDDDTIVAAFERMGRHDKTRPQELTMKEYVDMFNFVRAMNAGLSRHGEAKRENTEERERARTRRNREERPRSAGGAGGGPRGDVGR